MRDGQCPKCGATAVYRRGDIGKGSRANAIQISATPFPRWAWMDIYSCVNCGYSESYIADEKERSYIADHWTPVPGPADADGDQHARVTEDEDTEDRNTRRLPPLGGGR